MLALFTKNGRVIQGTGVTFALVGTSMHILNVINLMPSPVSHTWSTLAIAGFFLTSSSQISNSIGKLGVLNKSQTSQIHKNDVALP